MVIKTAKDRVLIYMLSFLIVYPLFFAGLFFEEDAFLHVIFTTVAFGLCIFYFNKKLIPNTKLDWSLLLFVLLYILTISVSYNVRESLVKAIRLLDYYMIYLMLKETINDVEDCLNYIKALFIGGVGVALIGLLSAINILNVEWAAVDGRIYSTIQYPNTLAVFLLGIFILTIFLVAQEKEKVWQAVYLIGSYFLMITFWGAHSRIVMVMYPFMVILSVVGLPKDFRYTAALYNVVLFGVSFFISSRIMPFGNEFQGLSLIWVIVGAILSGLLVYGRQLITNVINKVSAPKNLNKTVSAVILVLLILLGAFFAINDRLSSINIDIGKTLLNQLEAGFGDSSLQTRFVLYQDAFRIVQEHPILGTGGGGWKVFYYKYQRHYYQINDVHSSIMDVWIETGTVGLAIFISIWMFFLSSTGKIMLSDSDSAKRSIAWSVTVAVLALGIHSVLDFDLTLGAISILLWSYFGLISGLGLIFHKPDTLQISYSKNIKFAVMIGAIISSIFSGISINAIKYFDAAELAYNQGKWEDAKVGFMKAASLDPLSSKYDFYIGKTLGTIGELEGKPEMYQEGLLYAIKAVEKDQANADAHFLKAKMHLAMGDYNNALKEVELTYQYTPLNQKALNYLARMYVNAAKKEIEMRNIPRAREFLKKAVEVPQKVNAIVKGLDPVRRKLWIESPLVTVTPEIQQAVDEARVLLKVTGEK